MFGTLLLLLSPPLLAGVAVGSYGRVQSSSDLEGGEGTAVNVVSHGTRLEAGPYLEMDFVMSRKDEKGASFEAVITPALQGDLFHYDGTWDADLALRNLYVEASRFSRAPLSAWAGSRMYRGDDVYLLDFWPLDEVNTVGGGIRYRPEGWDLSAHVGFNRLTEGEWQVQELEVPDEGGLGTESVLTMDRQRAIATAGAARLIPVGENTLRIKGYAEVQGLPEGTRLETDEHFDDETLPAQWGSLAGVQLSAWGWAPDSFVHLFVREATGLAAFGELTVPIESTAPDQKVTDARELMVALSGNTQSARWGSLVGAYVRRFEDGDGVNVDVDDRWEAAVALRPVLFTSRTTSLGMEVSQQWLRPDGLNPHTRDHDVPLVTKIAFLPALQPEPGTLARPQIRLQYILTLQNDDARLWYDEADVRRQANLHQFVGIGAEWWMNSRSYR